MFLMTLLLHLALHFLGFSLAQQAHQDGSLVATTSELVARHRNDLLVQHVSPPVAAPLLYPAPALLHHIQRLEPGFPPPFAAYPPLAGAHFYFDENAMVLDENAHLKRSHRELINNADEQQTIVLAAGINQHGEQQIAFESIDTADYHGDEDDDDLFDL